MKTLTLLFLGGLLASTIVTAQSSSEVPKDPAALGFLNLHKRHPDAIDGPQEFDSYTTAKGLSSLDRIREFLTSFRTLTREVGPRMDPAELKAIGNTNGGVQTIGFHNIPLDVQATLLKQAYQLAQTRYELAQLKFERKQATVDDVVRARTAFQAATIALQRFWDTNLPTD